MDTLHSHRGLLSAPVVIIGKWSTIFNSVLTALTIFLSSAKQTAYLTRSLEGPNRHNLTNGRVSELDLRSSNLFQSFTPLVVNVPSTFRKLTGLLADLRVLLFMMIKRYIDRLGGAMLIAGSGVCCGSR